MHKSIFFLLAGITVSCCIAMQSNAAYARQTDSGNGISSTEKFTTSEIEEQRAACDRLRFKAYKVRQEGNNKEASILFQQAIREYKDPIHSAMPLTETLMEQGRYSEATDVYRSLVYEHPGKGWMDGSGQRLDTVMRFVFALSVTGNKGEAWDVFQANANRIPEDLQPLLSSHAEGLRDREHYNDITLRAIAMTVFGYTYPGKVVMLDEKRSQLGEKAPDAIAAYRLALNSSPRFAPAHYFLASMLKSSGDMAGAKEEWAKAKQYAKEPELQAMISKNDNLYKVH